MSIIPKAAKILTDFKPQHDFFVGIDSDGCAFDAMEIKHKECFTPNTIKHWRLQAVSKYARETAEFVNLYSQWRGQNRWIALKKVFDLLAQRPEVQTRGVKVPVGDKIQAFITSGYRLAKKASRSMRPKTLTRNWNRASPGQPASTPLLPTWYMACRPLTTCGKACKKCKGRPT